MTDGPDGRAADGSAGAAEPRAPELAEALRRRLDDVFGDVLPATTSDERDPAAEEPDPEAALLADRPPHHDRGA